MSTPTFASAADTAEQKAEIVELGPDVYGYVSAFDPNCGFVVGDDGVLVVDARATPAMAREFIDDIKKVTDKPVKYIFLTHYHAVRVLGASAFGIDAVFASRGTRDLIEERGAQDWKSEVERFPRLFKGADEIPGLTRPKVIFDDDLAFDFGGREVRLMHLGRGHTKGDTICHVPDCGVVFAGDLVENRCGVYMGDSYPGAWMETLERLRALRPTVMVPGRGAATTDRYGVNEAIDSTKDFVLTMRHEVGVSLSKGEGLRDAYRRVDEAMRPKFGDWPIYEHCLAFDVSRVYDELRGIEHPIVWTAERDAALWQTIHEDAGRAKVGFTP